MALNPQVKSQLMGFTNAAKKIIFDADRMAQFLKMLGDKNGALVAVNTVMSVIEKTKPIPPDVAPLLGVNIYMLMVDMAQDVTGHKADAKIMQHVVATILASIIKSHVQGKPPQPAAPAQPPAPPAQPAGLINQGA